MKAEQNILNRIRLLLLLVVLFCYSCTDKGNSIKNGYTINGYIEGIDSGQAKLGLLELGTNKGIDLDSVAIINGRFIFTGKVHSPYQYDISINDTLGRIYFFLENSNIVIKGNKNDISNAKISGSKEDSLYQSAFEFLFDKKKGIKIIEENPEYTYSAFAAYYQFQVNNIEIGRMDSIMNNFTSEVQNSTYYNHLKDIYSAVKKVRIGEKAPNFSLPNLNNEIISLDDFDDEYRFIHFGYSEMSYYDKFFSVIHEKFTGKSFRIISISVDKNFKDWSSTSAKKEQPWINLGSYNAWGTITDTYGVKYIAQNFLLNKDGIIIRKNIDYQDLEKTLDSIFK